MSDESVEIFRFEKNSAETVRVTVNDYRGGKYVDFRVWTDGASRDLGEEGPTKKGLCISTELLPDLLKAVQAAILHVDGVEVVGEAE